MANLLHIDCSLRSSDSVTRDITGTFVQHWRQAHPAGNYTYRNLGISNIPHLDEATLMASFLPPEARTAAQADAWAVSEPLINELRDADTILLGVPMYNFSIPSVLKVWLDRVTVQEHMVDEATGAGLLDGRRVVVVTARGGAYGPGTPREDFDFQEPYLRAALGQIGLAKDLTFVHTEMTLAHVVPALEQFKELADRSRAQALHTVRELAVLG